MKTLQELFAPKAPSERKFFNAHVKKLKVTPDANGNGDDVFKGANVKTFERKKNRYGYDKGADEKAYDFGATNGQNEPKKPIGGPVVPVKVLKEDEQNEADVNTNCRPDKGGGLKFSTQNKKGGYFGRVKGTNKGELYQKAAEMVIGATGDASREKVGHFLDSDHGAYLAHASNQVEDQKKKDLETFKDNGSKNAEHDKKVSATAKTLWKDFSNRYHPAYFAKGKTNEDLDESGEPVSTASKSDEYRKRASEHDWDSVVHGFKEQETYGAGTMRKSASHGKRADLHKQTADNYRKLADEHEKHGD